jgi:hypothetical protein
MREPGSATAATAIALNNVSAAMVMRAASRDQMHIQTRNIGYKIFSIMLMTPSIPTGRPYRRV